MRHPTTGDLHLAWDVPYQPGTLRVVGMKDGEIACEQEITTAGDPAQLQVTADREGMRSDGRDVVHITVRVLDQHGSLVPDADNRITFEVNGSGQILGVDNGDPADMEPFQASDRKAFHGMCLAVIQSSAQPGEIQVDVSSPGLSGRSLVVDVGK